MKAKQFTTFSVNGKAIPAAYDIPVSLSIFESR